MQLICYSVFNCNLYELLFSFQFYNQIRIWPEQMKCGGAYVLDNESVRVR